MTCLLMITILQKVEPENPYSEDGLLSAASSWTKSQMLAGLKALKSVLVGQRSGTYHMPAYHGLCCMLFPF